MSDEAKIKLKAITSNIQSRHKQHFAELVGERVYQELKWGEQNHHPYTWVTITLEEFGELAKALLEWDGEANTLQEVRKEAIQTAACCLALLDFLDRKYGPEKTNIIR